MLLQVEFTKFQYELPLNKRELFELVRKSPEIQGFFMY